METKQDEYKFKCHRCKGTFFASEVLYSGGGVKPCPACGWDSLAVVQDPPDNLNAIVKVLLAGSLQHPIKATQFSLDGMRQQR